MARILVTGASGFVGRRTTAHLMSSGHQVFGAYRQKADCLVNGVRGVAMGDLTKDRMNPRDFEDMDCVVHLAARAHVLADSAFDPLDEYMKANAFATLRMAEVAAKAGVRRFVFLSSIKVNGERTALDQPFSENSPPNPQDHYAESKLAAEEGLWRLASESGLEVVVLRPPLVYGPEVRANFLRLMQWIDKGIPLPLASVCNGRTLLYVGNLADAIHCAATMPAAAGETFLLGDAETMSTPDLVRHIAAAMGKSARLWPVPEAILRLGGRLAGREDIVGRLTDSLVVDSSRIGRVTGWAAPYTLEAGMEDTSAWFRKLRHSN